MLTVNRASKSLNQVIKFWWLWRLCGAAMEAFELSKLINSINSILLQDVSTIKTISSTEMWPPIYVCNMDKFVPLLPETLFHFPKRFSWNVRMFYRSKQLIEHLNQQFKSLQAHSTIKTISSTEMWPSIYVCNMDKFVPLLPETLFHFPKRFSWNVRMFYIYKREPGPRST